MTGRMRYGNNEYTIPAAPPLQALAELDAAARALDDLYARANELTLDMDEQTRTIRVRLDDGDGVRTLTPTQLFALLV